MYTVTNGPALGSLGGGSLGGVTAKELSSAPPPAPATIAASPVFKGHWYDGLISPEIIAAVVAYGPTVGVASLAIWGVKKMFFSGSSKF